MKNFTKPTLIISKIFEVCHWVGAALMTVGAVIAGFFESHISIISDIIERPYQELSTYGFEVSVSGASGKINFVAFSLFMLGSAIIMVLMAMIFRNVNLIVKRSQSCSPFDKDNVRMLKEIGIFSILVPAAGFIMSCITKLIAGFNTVETSVSMGAVVIGIIVLCFTQYFVYGAKLESEVEGLV